MHKIIIAGSRDLNVSFKDIGKALDYCGFKPSNVIIISGGAKGVDTDAINFADHFKLPKEVYEAKWNDITVKGAVIKVRPDGSKYNVLAGHMRNKHMGNISDCLIAFWDGKSKGTKQMIDYMRSLDKPVYVVTKTVDKSSK